jgi:pseudaminic acid biosynthesis-associated methylase
MNKYKTDQENFWAGDFGTQYIDRNNNSELLASNLKFFSTALNHAGKISSCLEFGANIGMNFKALGLLYPKIKFKGVEINKTAARVLSELIGTKNVFQGSIFDYPIKTKLDLVLVKGVLIHINPEKLNLVYKIMYQSSKKYILVCEYYNPSPVAVTYRGNPDRLFKRDFAGEMLERYSNLKLADYGFVYRRDNTFPQDDISWFLLEKIKQK